LAARARKFVSMPLDNIEVGHVFFGRPGELTARAE